MIAGETSKHRASGQGSTLAEELPDAEMFFGAMSMDEDDPPHSA